MEDPWESPTLRLILPGTDDEPVLVRLVGRVVDVLAGVQLVGADGGRSCQSEILGEDDIDGHALRAPVAKLHRPEPSGSGRIRPQNTAILQALPVAFPGDRAIAGAEPAVTRRTENGATGQSPVLGPAYVDVTQPAVDWAAGNLIDQDAVVRDGVDRTVLEEGEGQTGRIAQLPRYEWRCITQYGHVCACLLPALMNPASPEW